MVVRALLAHLVVAVRLKDVEDRLDVVEVVHASTCRCRDVQFDSGNVGEYPDLLCPPLRRSSRPENILFLRAVCSMTILTRTMTMLSTLFCLFSEAIFCTQVSRPQVSCPVGVSGGGGRGTRCAVGFSSIYSARYGVSPQQASS